MVGATFLGLAAKRKLRVLARDVSNFHYLLCKKLGGKLAAVARSFSSSLISTRSQPAGATVVEVPVRREGGGGHVFQPTSAIIARGSNHRPQLGLPRHTRNSLSVPLSELDAGVSNAACHLCLRPTEVATAVVYSFHLCIHRVFHRGFESSRL